MSRILPALASLAAGVIGNGLLFVAARQCGLLRSSVIAKATGRPLTLLPVIAATTLAGLAAIAVRLALSWGMRDPARARNVFLALAGVVLAVSFASPLAGLTGAHWGDIMILEFQHIVAAVTGVLAAEWSARPTWTFGTAPYDERPIANPVAVVTGATSGIGAAVAAELCRRGYRVIGVGRNAEAARRLETSHAHLRICTGDLSSMRGAHQLAADVAALVGPAGAALLIHCAGTLKPVSSKTAEGIDENFAASFLGRFAFTEALPFADNCRIVNVAAAETGSVPQWMQKELASPGDIGNGMRAHGQAQLSNDLWVAALARRGMPAFGYGPGAVESGIRRELPAWIRMALRPIFSVVTRSPDDAARDILRLLLDQSMPSSGFASRDGLFAHDAFVQDERRQDALVALARQLVANATGTGQARVEGHGIS